MRGMKKLFGMDSALPVKPEERRTILTPVGVLDACRFVRGNVKTLGNKRRHAPMDFMKNTTGGIVKRVVQIK